MTGVRDTLTISKAASVADFVKHVVDWRLDGRLPIAFRGQKWERWPTLPGLFRPDIDLYDHEKNAVRDLMSVHPQEFRDDETMFDRLVRMQHFGLPTRLLDVTTNPLVALYFATEDHRENGRAVDGKVQALFLPDDRQRYFDSDRVSCMANLANLTAAEKVALFDGLPLPAAAFNTLPAVERLLWFIRIEKPHFEAKIEPEDLRRPVFVKPKMNNRRIIAQSGCFVVFGLRDKDWRRTEKGTDGGGEGLRLAYMIVPAARKRAIRGELERLGIHAGALFPEIDKAAEHIVRRYAPAAP